SSWSITSRASGLLTLTSGGGVSTTGGAESHPESTPVRTTSPPIHQRSACRPIMFVPPFCFLGESDHMPSCRFHPRPDHQPGPAYPPSSPAPPQGACEQADLACPHP